MSIRLVVGILGGVAAAVGVIYFATRPSTQTTASTTTASTGSGSGSGTGSLPAGPYQNLGTSAELLAGHVYLMSRADASADAAQLAADLKTAVSELRTAGYAVLGSWTAPPSGWPSDETLSQGMFLAAKAGSSQTNGADVTTWAAGGATS
jgi:hypothetical protein